MDEEDLQNMKTNPRANISQIEGHNWSLWSDTLFFFVIAPFPLMQNFLSTYFDHKCGLYILIAAPANDQY